MIVSQGSFALRLLMVATVCLALAMNAPNFRPPAVPLIVHDPYFSVWSFSDKLTDSWTRHWTGQTMALCGLVRVDGKTFRFVGNPGGDIPALAQTSCTVRPTTTQHEFEGAGIKLKVEFMSPAFADDLDTLSKPVSFIQVSYTASNSSTKVQIYMDTTAEWCVDKPDQKVNWSRIKLGGREALRIGSQLQPVLEKKGDDLRIDWGNLVLVPPLGSSSVVASDESSRSSFIKTGKLPESDDLRMPRRANDEWPVLGTAFDLAFNTPKSLVIAYDDQASLEWFRRPVEEYWRRNGQSFQSMLSEALTKENEWFSKASEVDNRIESETEAVWGTKYSQLASLSYRQSLGAHKIVADIDGKPMMFSKENFSNGCIGTVDVLYPAAPIMLAYNPELLEANLRPLFIYASLPRWHWDFAPHDLGTYPHANGQVYGGGERTEEDQMPVEESGNLLILSAALVARGGSKSFIQQYLPILDKWATFLMSKGLDPENQLCTDDFAGHLAHNANLSLKAIVALGAYSKLLSDLGGHELEAKKVRSTAESMASQWIKLADDGDHFRLAFDKPGTWSQKYNLVWDKILELKLFPHEVYQKEVAHYTKVTGDFGLPLDNRKSYTKLDWCVWTACLTDTKEEFERYISPLWKMANETSSRVPLTDWYETTDGKQVGFQARSVVGGVFIPILLKPKG